jgi:hypothetical protein
VGKKVKFDSFQMPILEYRNQVSRLRLPDH